MASQPPTLPAAALAGASAKARIDQIAVRLIFVPDGTRDTSQPTKLSGTVTGQNADGSLSIKTDKGDIQILLKDRGSLPQGLKIDIEIPAGRNPQQANIKASEPAPTQPSAPSSQPPPTLAQAIEGQQTQTAPIKINPDTGKPYISSQTPVSTPPLPLPVKLQPEMLRDVIASAELKVTIDKSLPLPIAGGTLQAGQMIRLLPIPPNSMPQNITETFAKPLTVSEMISNLVQEIENIPKEQTQLRTTLITVLSRLDFSSLTSAKAPPQISLPLGVTPPSSTLPPTSPPIPLTPNSISPLPVLQTTASLQPQTQLITKIDQLIQSIGLPTPFQGSTDKSPSPQAPSSLSLFNPSKSVDGKIIAFQNQSPTPTILIPATQTNVTPLQNTPVSPAQVLGFTDDGLPVLSVPLPNTGLTQNYTMQFKADNVVAGSPVFIALDPASTKSTQVLFIQSADGTLSLDQNLSKTTLNGWINSGTWDSMDNLLQNLTHLSPTHAQSFAQMMPSPATPHTMPALSLFFLSLLRSGDTDGWVGNEAVSLLRQMGKADIVRSLTSDMAVATRLENMQLPQDWRMTMLPFLWENQIHKAPLYYKHLPDDGDKDSADAKKRRRLRFLFDLNMSRMGGVQVDGFMQSERLDLILRTKSPLSRPMQTDMKRIYAGAMEKSRLTGDLSFQFKPEHWVDLSQVQEKTGLHA
jgi:hypothetical protein